VRTDPGLNASPKSLSRIVARGMVVAVAGGPHKAAAIRHVLSRKQEGPWITHLVTDHRVAGWVLEGEKDTSGVVAPAAV
jgi:DNA-binding transcriptional regulator LsrR (DeoR family)